MENINKVYFKYLPSRDWIMIYQSKNSENSEYIGQIYDKDSIDLSYLNGGVLNALQMEQLLYMMNQFNNLKDKLEIVKEEDL